MQIYDNITGKIVFFFLRWQGASVAAVHLWFKFNANTFLIFEIKSNAIKSILLHVGQYCAA